MFHLLFGTKAHLGAVAKSFSRLVMPRKPGIDLVLNVHLISSSILAFISLPRKRSSGIRRAIQAAVYEQNKNLRREANAQVRAAIEPQVAEPQVAEPQVAEPQVAEPQAAEPQVAEPQVAEPQAVQPRAIKQKSLEERIRQAVGIFNIIQDLHRRIPPQLLTLAQQAAGNFQFQNAIQPVSPREDEHVLQLAKLKSHSCFLN
ncbi:hypothetical protein DAPPUDRAFT_323134 [Daphnia pulex]|uniref:Uncharacterized protein n=1 Tax=Daphnia pulex TaxID=6669 RepID=E9GY03_DAPPU|nr:hypothetical protein DAPPUDRAFT_323134 [Daphnia pulex]|eukprot:EFX75645.1 hypothetical protein DAPPUDRAFT_323134 [Daphnia pulex]